MNFEVILDDCLERMKHGESLDACLARYPEYADALRPLLHVGNLVRTAPPTLSAEAFQRGRTLVRSAAEKPPSRFSGWFFGAFQRGLLLPATAALAFALLVVIAGAVRQSAPGDLAYPLRRLGEAAALRLTSNPAVRAERHLDLAQQSLEAVRSRWQASQEVDRQALQEMIGATGNVLVELGNSDNPEAQRRLLGQVLALTSAARAWFADVATTARTADADTLRRAAEQLGLQERWARAAIANPAVLRLYRRDSEPPLLPTSEPGPTEMPAIRQATPTPSPAATATSPFTATPVRPTATPTAVPPSATPTAVPPSATPTAVPPSATPTAVPPTATPTAVPPTATPTAVPPAATPTAVPPSATPTVQPPTPSATMEPTESPEPSETPEAARTPEPTDDAPSYVLTRSYTGIAAPVFTDSTAASTTARPRRSLSL